LVDRIAFQIAYALNPFSLFFQRDSEVEITLEMLYILFSEKSNIQGGDDKMTAGEWTLIIVALINTGGAIICALIGRKNQAPDPESSISRKIVARKDFKRETRIFIYLALICFVLFFLQMAIRPAQTDIRITYPQDQALSDRIEMIQGTSRNIPDEHQMWLVIFSKDIGKFYPQENPILAGSNGMWSKKCYVGSERDAGRDFELMVVLADPIANSVFLDYIEESESTGKWPGMNRLPEGAEIHAKVNVIRR